MRVKTHGGYSPLANPVFRITRNEPCFEALNEAAREYCRESQLELRKE